MDQLIHDLFDVVEVDDIDLAEEVSEDERVARYTMERYYQHQEQY